MSRHGRSRDGRAGKRRVQIPGSKRSARQIPEKRSANGGFGSGFRRTGAERKKTSVL